MTGIGRPGVRAAPAGSGQRARGPRQHHRRARRSLLRPRSGSLAANFLAGFAPLSATGENEGESRMKAKRIGVVMGGTSAEREVSLRSGDAVAAALGERGYEVERVVLGTGIDALDRLRSGGSTWRSSRCTAVWARTAASRGCSRCSAFPYTGSSVLGSALAMDKLKAKELFRLHNVPTPPYYVFEGDRLRGSRGDARLVRLPGRGQAAPRGSSIGVTRASNMAELARAIDAALALRPFGAGRALHRGPRGSRRDPRRARARRHRDRAEERHVRLRRQVHARNDRVLHAGAPARHPLPRRPEPRRARRAGARHAAARRASICS